MGNIISYFFPQPAPEGIEQVEEALQEDHSVQEVFAPIKERKTSALVRKILIGYL